MVMFRYITTKIGDIMARRKLPPPTKVEGGAFFDPETGPEREVLPIPGRYEVEIPPKPKKALKPLPPPRPVGNEAFFFVPKLEQLSNLGFYKKVGRGKVSLWNGEWFRFHVFKHRERFFVAHTLEEVGLGAYVNHRQEVRVPLEDSKPAYAIMMEDLPAGDYWLAGRGYAPFHEGDDPSLIYILEEAFPHPVKRYIAVLASIRNLPVGTTIEVVREETPHVLNIRIIPGTLKGERRKKTDLLVRETVYGYIGGSFQLLLPP